MKSVVRNALAVAVAGLIVALSADPTGAATRRHHHHHHAAGVTAPVAGRHGHTAHSAARRGAHATSHHRRGHGKPASGRHAHHHRIGPPMTHRRHAALCQSVLVRKHTVERCRG